MAKHVYIMAYRSTASIYKKITNLAKTNKAFDWVSISGIMNDIFPIVFENNEFNSLNLDDRLDETS